MFRLLDSILFTEPNLLCHCFESNSTTSRWPLSAIFFFQKCCYLKQCNTEFTALTTSVCSSLRIYDHIYCVLVIRFIVQTAERIAIKLGIGTAVNFEL